jgi:hypothetical protein
MVFSRETSIAERKIVYQHTSHARTVHATDKQTVNIGTCFACLSVSPPPSPVLTDSRRIDKKGERKKQQDSGGRTHQNESVIHSFQKSYHRKKLCHAPIHPHLPQRAMQDYRADILLSLEPQNCVCDVMLLTPKNSISSHPRFLPCPSTK